MTLTEFLLARIAEDEAAARSLASEYAPGGALLRQPSRLRMTEQNLTVWNPARVLAECAAKRQIVGHAVLWSSPDRSGPSKGLVRADDYALGVQYGAEIVLYQLAQPYKDHPDFREEWRLDA